VSGASGVRWDEAPVVVTVAPCGAEVTRAEHPGVPHTPEEIARESIAAVAAGASVVHLHVREPDGRPSGRVELFRETIERIHAATDAIAMVSTGGATWMTAAERTTGLDAGPEMAGVESGSMNFGEDLFATAPPLAREILARAETAGIALEVEAFEVGHVVQAVRWHEQGLLPGPLRVNLVFGVPGGIDASPEALAAMTRPLPAGARWTVTAIGRHQRRMLALALLHGADGIRVGLEDAVYVRRGELAASNAALVELALELIAAVGRVPATPAQARALLSLPERAGAEARA
jgi:3-keto-5-aminohexanoate cleavage enzyme